MTHRSRIRILGLGIVAVALLTAPLLYQFAEAKDLAQHLLVAILGGLILRSSYQKVPSGVPSGLGSLLFGYYAWCQFYGVVSASHSFTLNSITGAASGLFAAWCCGIAALMLLSAASTKRGPETTSPIPAMTTSWALGGVAALYGVSGILQPGQEGFISTGVSIGFAVTLLGLGVLLLKGRHVVAASYGIGLAVASFAGWTFFTNVAFDYLIMGVGRLSTYGLMGALVTVAFLGSAIIGNEVAANSNRAPAKN